MRERQNKDNEREQIIFKKRLRPGKNTEIHNSYTDKESSDTGFAT
jgi:hypothetical protein